MLLAVVCGLGAWQLVPMEQLDAPWLGAWREAHPDPRTLGPEGEARHDTERGLARRDDVLLLLVGLAAGGLVLALVPARPTRPGGALAVVLVGGSVVVGLARLAQAAQVVAHEHEDGGWTLADDNLEAVAGPLAGTLARLREEIPADHALLVLGTQDYLLNLVAWSVHPRPVYPLMVPVPPGFDAAQVREHVASSEAGRDAPGRWLVDLEVLAGLTAERPAWVRLEP